MSVLNSRRDINEFNLLLERTMFPKKFFTSFFVAILFFFTAIYWFLEIFHWFKTGKMLFCPKKAACYFVNFPHFDFIFYFSLMLLFTLFSTLYILTSIDFTIRHISYVFKNLKEIKTYLKDKLQNYTKKRVEILNKYLITNDNEKLKIELENFDKEIKFIEQQITLVEKKLISKNTNAA